MKGILFVLELLVAVVDMVVCCSYSIQPFFCGGREEFIVVIEVYNM